MSFRQEFILVRKRIKCKMNWSASDNLGFVCCRSPSPLITTAMRGSNPVVPSLPKILWCMIIFYLTYLSPKTRNHETIDYMLITCYFYRTSGQSEKPIEKGQLMLGGAGSFGYLSELSESETSYGQLSFSLDPSVGFFVAHGFALGVSPSVGFTSIFRG